jgi:hypothetical protein
MESDDHDDQPPPRHSVASEETIASPNPSSGEVDDLANDDGAVAQDGPPSIASNPPPDAAASGGESHGGGHPPQPPHERTAAKTADGALAGRIQRRQSRVKSRASENPSGYVTRGANEDADGAEDANDDGILVADDDQMEGRLPLVGAIAMSNTGNDRVSVMTPRTMGDRTTSANDLIDDEGGVEMTVTTNAATTTEQSLSSPSSSWMGTPLILEATAVHEIVAAQVVAVQHVEIDNFDENASMMMPPSGGEAGPGEGGMAYQTSAYTGSTHEMDQQKVNHQPMYPKHQVAVVIVGVVLGFAGTVAIVFLGFADTPPPGYVEDECDYFQQQTLHHLDQLGGLGIMGMILSFVVGILCVYIFVDVLHNNAHGCTTMPPLEDREAWLRSCRSHFWPDLVKLVLDWLWLGTVLTSVITMASQQVVYPGSVLTDACGEDEALDEMGDLHFFQAANIASLVLLGCLVLPQCRSVIKSDHGDDGNGTLAWVHLCFWSSMAVHVVLIALAYVGYLTNLVPVLQQVQDYVNNNNNR